jgi:Ca2+-binding EF-hand superfamily protein
MRVVVMGILLAALGSTALAQRGGRALERFDKDGDGRLSPAEVAEAPCLRDEFAALDANKDGALSREELAAFHQNRKQRAECDGQGPKGRGAP